MSADSLADSAVVEELDDDGYFADLAAGTATPASALGDPDEPAGTAGRKATQAPPAPPVARRPRPRRERGRARGLDRLKGGPRALEKARARLLSSREAMGAGAAEESAEKVLEQEHVRKDRGGESERRVEAKPLRRWRPRKSHVVSAVAVVAIIVVISAGSDRPAGGPAKASGAANGAPAVIGDADLRLAWRGPTDARPHELTLGGRLTAGPDRTPIAGARLDVLAGDQAGTARQLARVQTDGGGRFRLALSVAGRPPGLLTVSFLARSGDTVPAALASARLKVRSAAPPPRKRRSSARADRRGTTNKKEKK